jgi:hypothetical protein
MRSDGGNNNNNIVVMADVKMEFQNSYEIFPTFIYFFQYLFVLKKVIIIVLFTDSPFQKFISSNLISTALLIAFVRTDNKEARQTAIQIQLYAYNEEALILIRINRPANIKRTYELKQKKWTINSYFNIFIIYI